MTSSLKLQSQNHKQLRDKLRQIGLALSNSEGMSRAASCELMSDLVTLPTDEGSGFREGARQCLVEWCTSGGNEVSRAYDSCDEKCSGKL
ncbi:hypothetical protein EYF80_009509 [Liparis tanakae]|uniref:Uncharacterized protein n=1 Tax=Liparis tanakae TaxID=230148 RepID=A0A4Z2IRM3_9TELE|nr:hypothetical protein EYF80_009509 [Liparis tanakae]